MNILGLPSTQYRRSRIISPEPHYSQLANDGRYKLATIDGYDVVRCWGKHISIVRGLRRGSVARRRLLTKRRIDRIDIYHNFRNVPHQNKWDTFIGGQLVCSS